MAREILSAEIEIERKDYGVELFRESSEESIKITHHELDELNEMLE